MARFRATVYHLSSVAEAVEGDKGWCKFITEQEAEDEEDFKNYVRDLYIRDVDAQVEFGPITRK